MDDNNHPRIGITGGIGSGKSYVCHLLGQRGIAVYDCDSEAKRLMSTSPEIIQGLIQLVGPDAYVDGQLNKTAVTRFLLKSKRNNRLVNSVVHPAVFQDFLQSGKQWVESAILFDCGLYRLVDHVVCVSAPLEVRIRRIMLRDSITRNQAMEWVAKQMPQEEVEARSDFRIINDGETDVSTQLDHILTLLDNHSF